MSSQHLATGSRASGQLVADAARFAALEDTSLFGVAAVVEDLGAPRAVAVVTAQGWPDHGIEVELGWKIATALRRKGHTSHAHARVVVEHLLALGGSPGTVAALRLLRDHLDVRQHHANVDWRRHVPPVITHSNTALDDGNPVLAVDLLMIALDLLFDNEHHADVVATPLIDDTDTFLAPLRDSAVLDLLASPSPPQDAARPQGSTDEGASPGSSTQRPVHVAILLNQYRHFADEIVASLESRPDVEVRIEDRAGIVERGGRIEQGQVLVDQLGARGIGNPSPLPDHDRQWLEWADVVFVDWADVTAQWASLHTPATRRLVVRMHSIEALRADPHLVDWSRVDDLVFVGEHVRDFQTRAVPTLTAPDGPRLHVLPNAMDLQRFDTDKAPGADRTLALIGWAQRVKDPVWALEVLARLRRDDPDWQLLLVGHGFSSGHNLSNRYYRYLFDETIERLGLGDSVHDLGYRTDLDAVLRDVGFILSSSRRESFGVALSEGAASGAVPVVRHWTMYHQSEGPRSLFPEHWVVDDVEEAAARILSRSDPRVRAIAGSRARRFVLGAYDWSIVHHRYHDLLTTPSGA